MWTGEPSGQGWLQIGELGLAFLLSALIGVEREIRHKSAGLRTYTLVGFAAALIMLVSKYGFTNILVNDRVVLDPSRIAAQIVTGIGFIGGGLIFVRRDNVRGLTTAAIVWLTAAIGMACGAGLPILALAVTAGHFIVVFAFPLIAARLPRSRWTPSLLQVSYQDGREILHDVLITCTRHNFAVSRLHIDRVSPTAAQRNASNASDATDASDIEGPTDRNEPNSHTGIDSESKLVHGQTDGIVTVALEVQGTGSIAKLAARLAEIPGVVSVTAGDVNVVTD
jgi:putative Mg2+ transporter-C (MgtC) family protein